MAVSMGSELRATGRGRSGGAGENSGHVDDVRLTVNGWSCVIAQDYRTGLRLDESSTK